MTSSSRKRTTAERMLLDAGINPEDCLAEGHDRQGYWKFGDAPKDYDGDVMYEQDRAPRHKVPWPPGFDYTKFRWAVSVMDMERRTGRLADPPMLTINFAPTRSAVDQMYAYHLYMGADVSANANYYVMAQ